VRPKHGLYRQEFGGIGGTIALNYSCHTREVIARFAATESRDCDGAQALTQGVARYSMRMPVAGDGSFRQDGTEPRSQGIRWSGRFTSATTARVSFAFPACSYAGRADNMAHVEEGPFPF
jgi:hypothetical protein